MSRVYQKPAASTSRQAPGTRPPLRQSNPSSIPARRGVRQPAPSFVPTYRDARASSIRGRTMHTQPERHTGGGDDDDDGALNNRTDRQERSVHVSDGYHMIAPSTTKREQMQRQAEIERRQYEEHIERKRLHDIHEVNQLGGGEISEREARQKLFEKYRRDKITRLEKTHQDQTQKKQEEESELENKKQAARLQTLENEKRARKTQLNTMRPTVNHDADEWTEEAREEDRRKTMDRFLDRLSGQCSNMNISSDENETIHGKNLSKSEKFSILHETLPHIDDQTLEYYFEIYDGNVDMIVQELLN